MQNYATYMAPKTITDPTAFLAGNDNKAAAKDKIHKAAKDFEAMFVSEMIRPMFEAQDVNQMFGGGDGEKMYRSMLVDEYGKQISKAGGIGLSKNIEKELLKLQEKQEKK